jgi:hypothetical protein
MANTPDPKADLQVNDHTPNDQRPDDQIPNPNTTTVEDDPVLLVRSRRAFYACTSSLAFAVIVLALAILRHFDQLWLWPEFLDTHIKKSPPRPNVPMVIYGSPGSPIEEYIEQLCFTVGGK